MSYADRLRIMLLGRPKAGKTGAIACLLNAGFRVGVLDCDLNPEPLQVYGNQHPDNLSIIPLRDRLYPQADGSLKAVDGKHEPQALLRAHRALDDWGKLDKDHPWGPVESWGPDHVLVLDSLTSFGDVALNNVLFVNNRQHGSMRRLEWGDAMRREGNFISWLAGPEFHCHFIPIAHIKLIGPQTEDQEKGADSDLVKAKVAIAAAMAEELPTRWYPTALGRALPQEILHRVPAAVLVEQDELGERWIYTSPPDKMPIDLGAPVLGVKKKYPQATGLLDILEGVCGYRAPPKRTTTQ